MTPDQQGRCRNELGRILRQCTELGMQLQATLEDERAAFAHGDPTGLQLAVDAKEALVRQMEELESQRCGICRDLGFEADDAGMRETLEQAGDDGGIGELWSELLRCARDAEKSNRINGAIARARHDQTMAMLAALHGATEAEPTYGERGKRSSRFESSPLTCA